MSQTDQERLQNAIRQHWPYSPGEKAQSYVGKFFGATRFSSPPSTHKPTAGTVELLGIE